MTSSNPSGSGRIDIMGISETGEGIADIDLGDKLEWFGINKNPPNHKFSGVGAIVRKEVASVTSIVQEISNHNIIWLQILTNKGAIYIAIAYCSPNNIDELTYVIDNVNCNYEKLSKVGKVLVMGDFNGRLGNITGDSTSNTRGKKIIKLCKDTGLEVVQSNQSPKWTFYHFNKGESVIDLVMINRRDKHSVSHLFVHSNIHFGSDHRLITFNWNIWNERVVSSTEWKETPNPKPVWTEKSTLQYTKLVTKAIQTQREQTHGRNSYSMQQSKTITEDVQWLVDIMHKSMDKAHVLIKPNIHVNQTNQQTDQYDNHISKLMTQRDKLLEKIKPGQSKMDRTTITSQATEIQKMISVKIQEIENYHHKQIWGKIIEMKSKKQTSEYWKMIRRVRKELKNKNPGLIISENKYITGEKNIANAFAETYRGVYEGKDNDALVFRNLNKSNENLQSVKIARKEIKKIFNSIHFDQSQIDKYEEDIASDELSKGKKKTKKRTSPGEDDITIEAIINGGEMVHEELLRIYNNWWKTGKIPPQIQQGQIVPIFKQGDTNTTKNYRPITLLNCIFKLYEKILETRLRKIIEKNRTIPELQKGAKSESSTMDALYTVLSALEQNESTPATIALLDLSKAYDRVWRKGLWAKLWTVGIRGNLLRAIMSTYSNPTMVVKLATIQSDTFNMQNGLRQGSVLSPLLFIILFSDNVKEAHKHHGLPLNTNEGVEDITGQCFVDDTILFATNPLDIIGQIDCFNYNAAIWGSVLNLNKTLILSNRKTNQLNKWMEEHEIKKDQLNKTSAKYLGVWISMKNNSMKTHYKHVMDKARRTMYFLKSRGVKKECLNMSETTDIIKKLILPMLTYACEVIIPSQPTINKINGFVASIVSEMTHIPKTCNPMSILWEANIECFETILAKAKLRFYFKIINAKSTSTYKYLIPGNYLHDEIQTILKKLNSEHLTPKFIKLQCEQKLMSKLKWKMWVKQVGATLNYQVTKQHNIQFLSMKQSHDICLWLQNIPTKHLRAFLTARHNAWMPMACPCTREPIDNFNLHIFMECTHTDVIYEQLALTQHLDDLLIQCGLEHLSQVTRIQILLGKQVPQLRNVNMEGIYILAAKLCHTAGNLTIK